MHSFFSFHFISFISFSCMYVCMCVCMYVCMHASMYVCAYMYVCMHVCACGWYVCIRFCVQVADRDYPDCPAWTHAHEAGEKNASWYADAGAHTYVPRTHAFDKWCKRMSASDAGEKKRIMMLMPVHKRTFHVLTTQKTPHDRWSSPSGVRSTYSRHKRTLVMLLACHARQ